jgi:hypothetical protein
MTDAEKNAEPEPLPKSLGKISRWYRETAVTVLSTLILISAFISFSYAYYAIRGYGKPPIYSSGFRPRAMHRMDTEQANRFFKEFDQMGEAETYIYQPWVGFSERIFHAPRLNVDEATPLPIRRTIQKSPNPAGRPLTIWVFGGSTMFGWGVPDEETMASHLSAILSRDLPDRSVAVTNHGHSYFFSSQELALFQMLLRRGDHCDIAVFLDGLNEAGIYAHHDTPAFTDRVAVAMEREQARNPSAQTYFWLSPDFPPLRLGRAIARRLVPPPAPPPDKSPTYDLVNTYQFNLSGESALGSTHGIKTLFFWQPVPADPGYAPVRDLAARVRQSVKADNFYYIADIFKDMDPRDVYVDYHHYGDVGNERIAEDIAAEVLKIVEN